MACRRLKHIREEGNDLRGERETLSHRIEMRLEQKLTRSLTRGIAFLFLRSGMLSMLYRAPPMLENMTHKISALFHKTAVKNLDTTDQLPVHKRLALCLSSYRFLAIMLSASQLLTLQIKVVRQSQHVLLGPDEKQKEELEKGGRARV